MKLTFLILVFVAFFAHFSVQAQQYGKLTLRPFLRSAFGHENVYKTKADVKLTKVYDRINHVPLNPPVVISNITTTVSAPVTGTVTVKKTTNPATTIETKTTITTSPGNSTETVTVSDPPTTYTLRVANGNFIRYTIVKGDSKPIIRILPGTQISSTDILYGTPIVGADDPSDFYFQFVDAPTSNTKYLATSTYMGMPLIMPLKYRLNAKKYINPLNASLTLDYAFGLRIRLGNSPYHEYYMNFVPLVVGIGKDTYVPHSEIGNKDYKSSDGAIFSKALGFTFEFASMNFGVFYGTDVMFGPQRNWYFQDKGWFSFGVGYKFGK
jgi:hypothetical protein